MSGVIVTIIISTWIALLIISCFYVIIRKILPKYKLTVSNASLEDIIMTLNVTVNTEFELWEKDVFIDDGGIANNSQYENFYNEISMNILTSLSEAFYASAEKYLTRDAIVTIVARQTKNFLNKHVQESFPDPTIKMLFDEA